MKKENMNKKIQAAAQVAQAKLQQAAALDVNGVLARH